MSSLPPARVRVVAAFAAGGALVAGGLAAGLAPGQSVASSHREAPLISGQPQYDNTDVYAFVSPDRPDTTTLVANFLPFQEPAGGPNFYQFAQDAVYDINIDNNGDSLPDITYRYQFHTQVKDANTFLYNTGPVKNLYDKTLNITQTYDLTEIQLIKGRAHRATKLAKNAPVAPSNVGEASMPKYADLRKQAIKSLPYGMKSFAGQADDSFFLDLRVFDLLYGGNLKEVGNDTLRGYNVNTVALQVPSKLITSRTDPVIGVHSTVHRRNASGGFTQVSRLGMPLVNEVVLPLKVKDRFNASAPAKDAQFAGFVADPELPKLIEQLYKIPAPPAPRDDLKQVFLTGVPGLNQPKDVRAAEQLRLNTSIKPSAKPNRLGVLGGDNAGFPNGRRLTDDVIDISLQAVEGELLGKKNDLGDAVNANDKKFENAFPYVALPHSGSDVRNQAKDKDKKTKTKNVSLLNAGAVSDDFADGGEAAEEVDDSGAVPMSQVAALGAGAALLTGGGLMWMRQRRRGRFFD